MTNNEIDDFINTHLGGNLDDVNKLTLRMFLRDWLINGNSIRDRDTQTSSTTTRNGVNMIKRFRLWSLGPTKHSWTMWETKEIPASGASAAFGNTVDRIQRRHCTKCGFLEESSVIILDISREKEECSPAMHNPISVNLMIDPEVVAKSVIGKDLVCANCQHVEIHNIGSLQDACSHPACNCGFDTRG